jgi:hypothetical protein
MGGQAFPGHFRGSHSSPFSAAHQHGFADGGAAQMPPGYSNFAASPSFAAPFLGMQVPHFSGTGGYSSPLTAKTPPVQAMMAMQPHARGGNVHGDEWSRGGSIEDAANDLCAKLEAIKIQHFARGGSIKPVEKEDPLLHHAQRLLENERAKGGKVEPKDAHQEGCQKILQMFKRVEAEMPRSSASARLSRLCELHSAFKKYLRAHAGQLTSRSGLYAQLHGYCLRGAGLVNDD